MMRILETRRSACPSWQRYLAIGVGVAFGTACIHDDHRSTQYAELKQRAAFDLKCDEMKLKVVPIKEIDTDYGCASQHHIASARTAGVTCKDSRATYELVNGRWLMNNDGRAAGER